MKTFKQIVGWKGLVLFHLKNLFASKQLKAHRKLMIITKALNEDWQPNYNQRFYFKSDEAAEYAGKQFKDDFQDYLGI